MVDVVAPEVRSRMMSNIRSKDTKHEVEVRKALHAAGLRYRLHRRDLPGTPDITFPRHRAVVFLHGCFWHGHDCYLFKWPSSNSKKWKAKIRANQQRDEASVLKLIALGWRVCTIWECALRGRGKYDKQSVVDLIAKWIVSSKQICSLRGRYGDPSYSG